MNSVRFDMTSSKELQQKVKMLDKLVLKNIYLHNISETLCHGHI